MGAGNSAEITQNVSAQTQNLIILNQAFLHFKFKAKSTCKYLHSCLSEDNQNFGAVTRLFVSYPFGVTPLLSTCICMLDTRFCHSSLS